MALWPESEDVMEKDILSWNVDCWKHKDGRLVYDIVTDEDFLIAEVEDSK